MFLCFILFLMMESETVLRLFKQSIENTTLIMELFFAMYKEEANYLLGFSIQGLISYQCFKIYRLGEQIQFGNNLLRLKLL